MNLRGLMLNHIKNPALKDFSSFLWHSKASRCCKAIFYFDSQRLQGLCNKNFMCRSLRNLVAESPLFCSPSSGREGALRTYCTYSQRERGQQRLQTAPSPFFLKQHWSRGTPFSESVEIQMVSKVKDVLVGVDREKRLDVLLSQSQKKFPQSNTFAWDSS